MTAGDPIIPLVPAAAPQGPGRPDGSRPAAHLRLVAPHGHDRDSDHDHDSDHDLDHDHEWRLRSVEFHDGASVRELGCSTCDAAWFEWEPS